MSYAVLFVSSIFNLDQFSYIFVWSYYLSFILSTTNLLLISALTLMALLVFKCHKSFFNCIVHIRIIAYGFKIWKYKVYIWFFVLWRKFGLRKKNVMTSLQAKNTKTHKSSGDYSILVFHEENILINSAMPIFCDIYIRNDVFVSYV